MAGLFISYRRRGSQGFAGRLADDLSDRFGEDRVFRDVEIRPGDDFTQVITSTIATCNALLVVIGPHWLDHGNEKGQPRLHEPDDWVRLEIEAALAKGTWIVPVLVGGARMPAAAALPESLQRLSRIQAVELTDRRWDWDVEQLQAIIVSRLPGFDRPKKTVGPNRNSDRGQAADASARAISDVGRRMLEAIQRTRKKRSRSFRSTRSPWSYIGAHLGRVVKQVVSIVILLGVAYFLIQNYADPATKRMVNDLISRITALL